MDQKIPLDRDSFEQLVATASILQQLQKHAEALKTRVYNGTVNFTHLIEVQQEIQTGSLSPEAALLRVVSLALRLVPAAGAGIWLFADNEFHYRAGAGTACDDEDLRATVLSRLPGTTSSMHSGGEHGLAAPSLCTSLVIVPIFEGPKIAGALAVFSDSTDAFTEQDAATTHFLAGLAAHAVDKAANAKYKQTVSLEREVVLGVIGFMVPRLRGLADMKEHTFPSSASGLVVEDNLTLPPGIERGHELDCWGQLSAEMLASLAKEVEKFLECDPSLSLEKLPGSAGPMELVSTPTAPAIPQAFCAVACPEGGISEPVPLPVPGSNPKFPKRLSIARFCQRAAGAVLRIKTRFSHLISSQRKIPATVGASLVIVLMIVFTLIGLRVHFSKPLNNVPTNKIIPVAQATAVPAEVAFSEISHKRVTDADAATALRDLSPFEIPGLRRQARYGDASAAFVLGMAYETGYGVRQDCARAAHWVAEAAEDGNAAADYNLAFRYRNGDGVPPSIEKFKYSLQKAAREGYPEAQAALTELSPESSGRSSSLRK